MRQSKLRLNALVSVACDQPIELECDGQREAAFVVQETEAILTLTPLGLTQAGGRWRYRFPGAPGDRAEGFPITELMAVDAPTEPAVSATTSR